MLSLSYTTLLDDTQRNSNSTRTTKRKIYWSSYKRWEKEILMAKKRSTNKIDWKKDCFVSDAQMTTIETLSDAMCSQNLLLSFAIWFLQSHKDRRKFLSLNWIQNSNFLWFLFSNLWGIIDRNRSNYTASKRSQVSTKVPQEEIKDYCLIERKKFSFYVHYSFPQNTEKQ